MENAQNTTTDTNVQNISNATIQWGTGVSTKEDNEKFDFPSPFETTNIAVILNRTVPNADDILPVMVVDNKKYEINRANSVKGDGQTFNMLAIGGVTNAPYQNYSPVLDVDGAMPTIQWGVAETSKDGDEDFNFPKIFNEACYAVLTNRTEKNGKTNLPVVSKDKKSFTINRPNTINGSQQFYWVAIGDCGGSNTQQFSFPIGGGRVMKGGRAVSTSDSAEFFSFSEMGLGNFSDDCFTVVTTRTNSGSEDILPVTDMSTTGFTIDRSSGLVGDEEFYWLAIGE